MKFRRIISAVMAACIALPTAMTGAVSALEEPVLGDVNADTYFNLSDIVMYQRWLSGKGELVDTSGADVNGDGELDIFDLSTMRKMLIEGINSVPVPSYAPNSRNLCAGINNSGIEGKKADKKFIESQMKFTVDLLKATTEEGKNNMISPYSVMQALAMTANGANGKTLEEMEQVLGNGMSIEELDRYLLTQRLNSVNKEKSKYNNWSMNTANSIWAIDDKSRIQARPEFIQKCVDYYNSDYYIAPFDQTTLDDVNGWVNEKTNKMIPKILNKISEYDVMYLVNAVAFEAQWAEQYESYQIKDSKFNAANGEKQDAKMLCSDEFYLCDENTTGMLKSYSGGKYAFAALLPEEGTSVEKYVADLTPEKLTNILNSYKGIYERADVELPKFKCEYGADISDQLVAMGMPTAFDKNPDLKADFTNLSAIADIHPISIGYVIHKTFIDLDENGTKAAAATLVAMQDNGAFFLMDKKEVILDRPFVYCIIDTETSIPVFIGVLNSLS